MFVVGLDVPSRPRHGYAVDPTMSDVPRPPTSRYPRLLFPDPPREFRGRRTTKIVARAIHATCAGVYAGAIVFDVAADARTAWGVAAVLTGVVLLAIDLHESFAMLLQVRGLVVLTKLTLVAMLPVFDRGAVAVVLGLMIVAVLSSHAPSGWRYRMWAGKDRVRPSHSKG